MNKLLIIFIALNILNVIIQTIKSLVTVKSGKTVAALVNAGAYGLYTIVTVYMLCELPLWQKAVVVALCNLVGVYVVKWLEEKMRKDKLWKIEVTLPTKYLDKVDKLLEDVPHSYIKLSEKHTLFNFYCSTQAESRQIKAIVDHYNAKYFASESKILY